MAFQKDFMKRLFSTVFGILGIVFGSLAAALAVGLTTYFKRRNARRRATSEPFPASDL